MENLDSNCKRLRKLCREQGVLYVDTDFPAVASSLTQYSNKIHNMSIVWRRPPELVAHPRLTNKSSPADICQGRLGNCWFVAACACLVLNESAFRKVVVCPLLSSWADYCGIFEFRFWRFGRWIDIIIDDLLPTLNGELLYCHSRDPNEFWCALMEKAYAKLLGSYEALEGGELADALIDFTGGFTECIQAKNVHNTMQPLSFVEENSCPLSHGMSENNTQSAVFMDPDGLFPHSCSCSSDSAFNVLIQRHFDLTLIAAAISTDNLAELESETEFGLVIGHAYAVTRICSVPSRDSCKDVRLVCLTNPWGHGSWRGRFSHGSKDWESLSEGFKDYFSRGIDPSESGQFWMHFDDFLEHFNYIVLCHVPIGDGTLFRPGLAHRFFTNSLFAPGDRLECSQMFQSDDAPNSFAFMLPYMEFWTEVAIHGSWNAATSGGCLNFTNTFLNNPQIAFDVCHPDGSSLVLCLLQKTNRSFDRCDSTTGLHHIGMTLFRVEPNRTVQIISLQEPIDFVINSLYRNSRVVWLRVDSLPAGRYVVVPTTFGSECEADFMLRLIGPPPITAFQLKVDNSRRSSSPHRCKSQALQTRSPVSRLRRWLGVPRSPAPRASISPLVSPLPGPNLQRITLVEATVRFPRLLFQTMFTNATLQYSDTGPRVYARLTAFGQKINGSLCHLSSLDRSKCTGIVRFEESFLFPNNTKEVLHIQLFIRNPVFDELCGECSLVLAASGRLARRTLHHLAVRTPHNQQATVLPELSNSSTLPSSPVPPVPSSRVRVLIESALNLSDTDRNRTKSSLRSAFAQSDQLIEIKATLGQFHREYQTDWLPLMQGGDSGSNYPRNLSADRRGLLSVLVECD